MAQETGKEKEYAEYVYSSSELSKYYGLTIKGMEFYESRGLVKPERVGQGKVRRYSLPDSYRLYFTRLYKNMGLGIQQTAGLLEDNEPERLLEELGAFSEKVRRELHLRKRVLEETEHMLRMLARAQEPPFYEITEEAGFYRLFIRRFTGPHRSSREETQEYKRWNDCLPVANASLRFPLEDCLSGADEVDTEIGLLVRASDFEALGLKESGRTQRIPAGRFLHTLICGEARALSSKEWLKPALGCMRDGGLRQTGDAFTRMIMVYRSGEKEMRCDEAWFPVG